MFELRLFFAYTIETHNVCNFIDLTMIAVRTYLYISYRVIIVGGTYAFMRFVDIMYTYTHHKENKLHDGTIKLFCTVLSIPVLLRFYGGIHI